MVGRWRKVVVSVSVLVVLGLGARLWLANWRPEGTGPAGPTVPAEPFGRVWSSRPVLLVGLGDSVTAGLGAEAGYGYFSRLAQNPPDEFADMTGKALQHVFPRLRTLNLAVSGSTSLQHEADQMPRLRRQDPDTLGWVVMTTGGNDLIHNYGRGPVEEGAMYGATWEQAQPWVSAFEQRVDAMLDAVAARFPGGCRVFLANIYDPTDGVGDIEHAHAMLPPWPDALRLLTAYNEVLARCAARHPGVYLVDVRATFLGHGLHCSEFWREHYARRDPTYWYFENLEDPNQRGHDAVRRAFLLKMIEAAETLPREAP